MYTVDEKDRVIALEDFPQSSVGAPIPVIVSDEFTTVIAFYLQDTPEDWGWHSDPDSLTRERRRTSGYCEVLTLLCLFFWAAQ